MPELKDDLAFVRDVVLGSRRALHVDVMPLFWWGVLSLVGVVLAYTWPRMDSVWLWVVLVGLAWLLTGARVLAVRRAGNAALFAQRALATLWFSLLTAMTVIGFAGAFSGALPTNAITPVMAGVFGAGYLASSALLAARGLMLLALAWWLGALVLFLMPAPGRLAVFGLLLLFLLLLPVLWFRRRATDR